MGHLAQIRCNIIRRSSFQIGEYDYGQLACRNIADICIEAFDCTPVHNDLVAIGCRVDNHPERVSFLNGVVIFSRETADKSLPPYKPCSQCSRSSVVEYKPPAEKGILMST